jgi:drug/metabolite transporter (DMT)-like permease
VREVAKSKAVRGKSQGWAAVIYTILVPTVAAYYLNAWALARVPPSTVATYIYLQPLIALGLAPLILGERWSVSTLISAALIFAGVALVSSRRRGKEQPTEMDHPEVSAH